MNLVKTICAISLSLFVILTMMTMSDKAEQAMLVLSVYSLEMWKTMVLAQFAAYALIVIGSMALLASLAYPAIRSYTNPFVLIAILAIAGFGVEDAYGLFKGGEGSEKDAFELMTRCCMIWVMMTLWLDTMLDYKTKTA